MNNDDTNKSNKDNSDEDDSHSLTIRQSLKKAAKEVGEGSTVIGLPNIVRGEWPVKIAWALCILGLTGFSGYLVYGNISNYLKYDVVTQIRDINDFPSYFPTITLCNINYFQTDAAFMYLRDLGVALELEDIFNSSTYNSSDYLDLVNVYLIFGRAIVLINNYTKEDIQEFGYPLENVLFGCSFGGNDECQYTDFEWYFHPQYG